jgi:hypothetical protein
MVSIPWNGVCLPILLVRSGELVPQDPSDEPASVLLERIREERRQAEGAGGKRRGRGRSSKQLSLDSEIINK